MKEYLVEYLVGAGIFAGIIGFALFLGIL